MYRISLPPASVGMCLLGALERDGAKAEKYLSRDISYPKRHMPTEPHFTRTAKTYAPIAAW